MEHNKINENYEKYYQIIELLGSGQYGTVYKAKKRGTNEIRAIKIIEIDNNKDEFMKNIDNELNSMKLCSNENENSIKFYEYYIYQENYKDKIAIVMKLCDKSLQKLLDEKKEGFKSEEIYNIMSQLNNTFKIMNENNIIHRDIKLDNILIKYNSNNNYIVKLTDYGVSKRLINTIGKTFIGSPLTMAPEILEGNNNYDNKCDLWSIGIIIYQLYFKEYPYTGQTLVELYKNIDKLGKKLLKKTNNKNLDNLINSLLQKDPKKRINYEDYFNHPFFKIKYYNINDKI